MIGQNNETIMCTDDVLDMLDTLLEKEDQQYWDVFWKDKKKPIPFFVDLPDENLMKYVDEDIILSGKVMDIGCGNGRNTRYLCEKGFEVEGLDYSSESINWAIEASTDHKAVSYTNASFFDVIKPHGEYDFIYDSGCLHHIKPHRRPQYLKKICNLLKPGAYFGLVCFNEDGGTVLNDHDIYHKKTMSGGLGYSEEKLKKILVPFFEIIEFREMEQGEEEKSYGLPTLWTVLLKKADHH